MLTAEQSKIYREEGVVHLAGALSNAELLITREAFDWSIANPGKGATRLIAGTPGTFYGDLANPACFSHYQAVHDKTSIPQIVSSLWQKPEVWFMYEQVFLKVATKDESVRRTPWHQDLPYLPIQGDDLAVVWIAFEPLKASESLEFVVGSHRQTLYDGSRFDPKDDTIPLYGTGELPRLPDIEAKRSDWTITSYDTEPGDLIIFHPAMLHGGAPTAPGKIRSTLSLRYFGEDATVAFRPGDTMERIAKIHEGPNVHPMTLAKRAGIGAEFRYEGFPKVN
ncbi:MAG: phytanoyl-CoA dioxygenase family protein [bacterium]|jgi:ectoine hydroxylase-related dioxygenase (phytanoyl-CoA dioxygenase family)|nr:phytanoyl-CoA dioxygenase [Gammaproteobacteria bacterium]HIL85209.1 phytanoyl-CoA dioxygenase [Pseudomonadales bacterium]